LKLTPAQAHYVLNRLIQEGRLRARQVGDALAARAREIASLRERLAALELLGAPEHGRGRRGRPPAGPRARRRTRKLSPKVRALRKQQGKYMGFMRRLKPAQKAKVRAVREKQGLPAAIRVAESLARRSA
jgi:hypothetical protein